MVFQHMALLQRRSMPTYREIMRLAGFRSTNAASKLVKKLVARQLIQQDPTGRLLPSRSFSDLRMLGSVDAGILSSAEEALLETINLDEYFIQNTKATFLLRVHGDSMIDAGILTEDSVLVERREEAKDGDIGIAEIDSEWTMKFFRKHGRRTSQEPANKPYPPIVPRKRLRLAAVVIAVIRNYHA
jgi:repressor LexA